MSSPSPLLQLIKRDGIFYYIVICVVYVLNILSHYVCFLLQALLLFLSWAISTQVNVNVLNIAGPKYVVHLFERWVQSIYNIT